MKKKQFKTFEDARSYVRKLHLKNYEQWRAYRKSTKKPMDIPVNPARTYPEEWDGYDDWLGTGKTRKFRSFKDAREFVRLLGLKNYAEWTRYRKYGNKPLDIPTAPEQVYDEWIDWGDWLGTGTIAPQNKKFRSFEQARESTHNLKLKTREDWRKYCKSAKKPSDIPNSPEHIYKKEWKGMGDWLGTGTIATRDKAIKWRSFKEAREYAKSLGIKTREEWYAHCRSGKKPDDIPTYPWEVYTKDRKNK